MASAEKGHPQDPASNIAKVGSYDPDKYRIAYVSKTVRTNECMEPWRPPRLTQRSVGLYLVPTTYELDECPPSPTTAELAPKVIDRMVYRDKAFWVDKPGANAYTLHDAYYNYGMTTEKILPTPQAVFPRSYQYDLDCVRYRRQRACITAKHAQDEKQKPLSTQCRDCIKNYMTGATPFQLAWAQGSEQRRWRYYPNVCSKMTDSEIQKGMGKLGRPFKNEACNWYNENYPSIKYDVILRKFSK